MAAVVPPEIAPRLEGNIVVGDNRRIGFAEFGHPDGPAVVWMHGTPGGRRQVPHEARSYAQRNGIRVIGIDRPGIGSSTPHVYSSMRHFAEDLEILADRLGLNEFVMVGLSGGGPYTLASAHELSDRIKAVGVLGGVAPTVGVDAIGGGAVSIARYAAPALKVIRVPMAMGLTGVLRAARPFANTAIDLYARSSPEGDRELLGRPEFKAMFLDDILNASRKQISAPLADVLLFARHWGFELADVEVPVTWWHGDADHIVPFEHGEHMVKRLPTAELRRLPGQSHLGGLGVGEEVLDTLLAAKR